MSGARALTIRFGNLSIEYVKALEGHADELVLWGYEGDDCYYLDVSIRVTDFWVSKRGIHLAHDDEDWDLEIDFEKDAPDVSDAPCFMELLFNNPNLEYAVEVPYEMFEHFYYDDTFNGCCIAKWWKERTGSIRG